MYRFKELSPPQEKDEREAIHASVF